MGALFGRAAVHTRAAARHVCTSQCSQPWHSAARHPESTTRPSPLSCCSPLALARLLVLDELKVLDGAKAAQQLLALRREGGRCGPRTGLGNTKSVG